MYEIQHASLEQVKHTAARNLCTPISFTGMAKLVWPLSATSSTGWRKAGRYAWVGVLLVLAWVAGTVSWYALVLGSILFAVPWLIFTQMRRHRIREARAVMASRVEPPDHQS